MDPIPQLRPSTSRSNSIAGGAPNSNNNNFINTGAFGSSGSMFSTSQQSIPNFASSTSNQQHQQQASSSFIRNFEEQEQRPTSGRGPRVPSSSTYSVSNNNNNRTSTSTRQSPRSNSNNNRQNNNNNRTTSSPRSNSNNNTNRPRSTSANSKRYTSPRGGNNNNNNQSRPQNATSSASDSGIIGAKAAISALQHAVVGERSSSGMALEKQIAVNADVKSFAVVGSDVWMAHADGCLSVRDCRTGHAVEPTPLANQVTSNSEAILGQTPVPWSLLAVTPLVQPSNNNNNSQALSVSGSTVWVGFSEGSIEIFNADTRQSLGKCARHHSGGVYTLASFSNTVFSGSNDFQICMWHASDFSFIRQFSGHNNYVRCLHAEGALLFSGSDDCTIRVWNVTNGQEISRSTFHKKSGVTTLTRVGPNMWSGDTSGDIIVWRLQTMREDHILREHSGRITALKKVGRSRVYSAAADRLVCVWDSFKHSLLHRVAEHHSWVLSLAFPCSLTRHYVWTAAADATIRCFHHDEFTPMTTSLENSLEGAWYGCDYAPYRDLAESQSDEINSLHKKLDLLQESEKLARERASHVEMHLDRARAEITEIDIKNHKELKNLQEMKAHFLEFQAKEREIYNNLYQAQGQREEMRRELDKIKEENERLAKEAHIARDERDHARLQSSHMESLLQQAVKVQQENNNNNPASKMAASNYGSFNAGRPGSAQATRRTTTSPRTARGGRGSPNKDPLAASANTPRQSYFSGNQRPLILVTNSIEHAKIVSEMELEIADLNEKINRLQRVNSQLTKGGRTLPASAAGSFRLQQRQQQQQNKDSNAANKDGEINTKRDWASQAMDILSSRQKDRENQALAMSVNHTPEEMAKAAMDAEKEAELKKQQQQHQHQSAVSFVPQPPSI